LRWFNAREGFTRKDDQLPAKFYKPLAGEGPTAGVALDKQEVEDALDLYYHILGWTQDGLPTRSSLANVGIEWVAG
jgi:aldehyde:ferredoxin oxidoreductase